MNASVRSLIRIFKPKSVWFKNLRCFSAVRGSDFLNKNLNRTDYSLQQNEIEVTTQEYKQLTLRRKFCTESNGNIATYEEVKDLPNHPEVLLIDVREPEELQETGKIPTSINIPLGAIKRAFTLPEKYFLMRYNFQKPAPTVHIIFSCYSGKRAQQAVDTVKVLGYNNVKNYKGSWLEWAEREDLPLPK